MNFIFCKALLGVAYLRYKQCVTNPNAALLWVCDYIWLTVAIDKIADLVKLTWKTINFLHKLWKFKKNLNVGLSQILGFLKT